jgi:hypothetical protein
LNVARTKTSKQMLAGRLGLLDRHGSVHICPRLVPDKRGSISDNAPPIVARLGIEQGNWLQNCQKLEEDFRQVIGPVAAIEKFCKTVGQKWLQGIHHCRRCFG